VCLCVCVISTDARRKPHVSEGLQLGHEMAAGSRPPRADSGSRAAARRVLALPEFA
jgi:hypothetical protein